MLRVVIFVLEDKYVDREKVKKEDIMKWEGYFMGSVYGVVKGRR